MTSAAPRLAAPPSVGRITLLTTLFTALGPITMSMYAPAMPSLAASLGTTTAMVQLTLTVYMVAFAVAQLIFGPLSDRFGRKPMLMIGMGFFLAGSVAATLATGIEWVLVGRFVQAVGVCAGAVISRAIVRDLYDGAAAAQVMAAIGMALAVAPAVGPLLGGYLDVWIGWRAVFGFQVLCGAAITAIALTTLSETNRHPDPAATDPVPLLRNARAILANRGFLRHAGLNAGMLGGLFTFAAVGPFVFISVLGVPSHVYGWLTLFTTAGYFLGAWVARYGVARVGIDRLVMTGALSSSAGSLILLAVVLAGWISVPALLAPMVLMTLGIGMLMPGAMAGAMAPFPRIAGTASSLLGFLQMAAGTVGTLWASLMGEVPVLAFGVIPVTFTLAGMLLYLGLRAPQPSVSAG